MFSLALITSLSVKPNLLSLSTSTRNALNAFKASPSLKLIFPAVASHVLQSLLTPNPALRNGASGLAVMSSNLSSIISSMNDSIKSIWNTRSVLFRATGKSGCLLQSTSICELVASGSVRTPITGSAFSATG